MKAAILDGEIVVFRENGNFLASPKVPFVHSPFYIRLPTTGKYFEFYPTKRHRIPIIVRLKNTYTPRARMSGFTTRVFMAVSSSSCWSLSSAKCPNWI